MWSSGEFLGGSAGSGFVVRGMVVGLLSGCV